MSTLILPRRLPPHERRTQPELPASLRFVAPSSLFVPPQGSVIPNAWSGNALAILVALVLHGALAFWLMADHPQVPEPTPPMPITVQWVPPAPPPAAQPTPPPPEPVQQPEPPAPAPPQKSAPAEPKPVEQPKPKAHPRPAPAPAKTLAKPAEPAPSSTPTTSAPTPTLAPSKPAPAAAQTTTAPIGRAGYLNNPPPVYPPAAARRHQEGTTLLRVHVLPNGRADQVQVQQTSGVPALDEAAQAAVRQWTFIPAKRGDTPVEGWVNVPMAFKLAP
ncbi:energy transducer TonB [Pseudomonas syringae]|uniref:energy transducer TonB n=3 Tax=Pseudomonas syringae TaxID=317 RepID=UPI001F231DF8|nr:energy transducer TonB [Pseudomonas syringae]MCF5468439.1 TonB family protein [Pseudomonas syringae]MCF5474887.1 TonB family protein [Pseudomonas syringae]MCF5484891.1 TonB family protein [Pseudomonas syringae]MCF5489167.1 TonB family protein [Pseudomonas syringae]MCF5493205.1 TonB family protein [Pseudomonas syringae]